MESVKDVDMEFKIPGTPLLTVYGGGILLSYRNEDSMYEIRLWTSRGKGSATAFLNKSSIIRKLKASIGFIVSTPMGRGKVISIRHHTNTDIIEKENYKNHDNKNHTFDSNSNLNKEEDIYCVEFSNWILSTKQPVKGYFNETSVQCTGGIVLPVVELLSSQANLFLKWSATNMSGIVGEFSNGREGNEGNGFTFLDQLQKGVLNSGEILTSKFEESGGEEAINLRLDTTRTAANEILNEMKDAEKVENKIKTLLDEARSRVKELTIIADPKAKIITSGIVDMANETLTSSNDNNEGGGGVGIEDLTEKYRHIDTLIHDKKKINEIVENSKNDIKNYINYDENGKLISQKLGFDELQKTQESLSKVKESLVEVLKPSLKAAVKVTKSTLKDKDFENKNKDDNEDNNEDDKSVGKEDDQAELYEAMKLAEDFANKEIDLASMKLQEAKVTMDLKVISLNNEVNETLKTLKQLATKDEKLNKILLSLESEGTSLSKVKEKVSSSKALIEVLKGKEMISNRVNKLMQAPEVDTLRETGMRIGARFMDKQSVARRKSDQLLRAVTSKLQSKLLGVKQHADDPDKSISGLYDLLNVDALLESVEGDLIKFLMNKREFLVEAASGLDGGAPGVIKWDPRIHFMVSFIKDCAKVSMREQLEKGIIGLKDRLANPSSFKVPIIAIERLEVALLDLTDSAGGIISLGDLSNFWTFLQKGHTVESAAQEALALLPEEKAVEEFSQKSLTYALMKFGGNVPPSLKKILIEESGVERIGDEGGDGVLTINSSGNHAKNLWAQFRSGSIDQVLDHGIGYLNSSSVVDTVHNLVGESSGFLSAIETMREDTRIQVAMATLGSKDMEDKLMAGIENIDVAELMTDAELAATDINARQRLVDGMKNACLDFLLQYLPSMPIPPIEGEEDGLEYGVSNLDLSRFKLKKEDVEVKLGDLAGLSAAAMKKDKADTAAAETAEKTTGTAAAAAGSKMKHSGSSNSLKKSDSNSSLSKTDSITVTQEDKPDSTILTLTARNISAEFIKLHWSYKQRYFPYLEGGGSCDAVVTGCSISISFEVRKDFRKKRQVKKGTTADSNETVSSGSGGGGVKNESATSKKNMASGSEGSSVFSAFIDVASGGTMDTQSGMMGEVLNSFSASKEGGKDGIKKPATSLLWEPVMVLGKCHVSIDDLTMRMSGEGGHGSMAWVYNILASLFRQQIREYIITSLTDSIHENAEVLLGTFNGFVRNSWPVLSAATNANLDSLPLLNHSIAAGQVAELQRRTLGGKIVNITLNQPGALGLHLDINSKRGVIRFTSPVKGGQAEASCKEEEDKLGLNKETDNSVRVGKDKEIGSALKGAYLTKINGAPVGGVSVSDTLVMLKSTERPLILSFVLPASKKLSHKKHNDLTSPHGTGGAGGHTTHREDGKSLETVTVSFTTASLGLKIKQLINLPQLVTVIGFARDPTTNEMLPAEASNQIKVGMLLLRVNDLPLWGEGFKEVAMKLKVCATAAAQGGPPLILTFALAPDLSVQFPSNPTDLMLSTARTDGIENVSMKKTSSKKDSNVTTVNKFGVVVSGFKMNEMGPVQSSGLVLEGDTLVGCNGKYFPIGGNYRDYVASLKDQTYPLNLEFEGLRENTNHVINSTKVQYEKKFIKLKIENNPSKKLGVVFGCGNEGLPIIRRFEYVPGVAARYDGVKPGMLLLQIGKVPIDPDVINAAHKQSVDKANTKDPVPIESTTSVHYETVNHPLPIDTIKNLLNESTFPSTVIRFRDMDKYLKLKEFASGTKN